MNAAPNPDALTTFGQRFARWGNPPWWYAFVTLPWAIGVALCAVEARQDSIHAARQQTTLGVITAHDPSNHNSYQYTYAIGGRTFRAWQIPQDVEWRMGEQVVVYYDAREPGESSLIEFAERSEDDAGPIPLALLGIGGVIAYIAWQRYHNARPRSAT